MNSGINGMNPGPNRSSSGSARSASSAIGGAVPKVKLRKKMTGHSSSQPLLAHQPSHQVHPQSMPQQLTSRMHQHSPTNGHFQSNIAASNSNGLLQATACKNIPKNLLLFDWQGGEVLSSQRSCRNRHISSELYDSASDESVSQDNRQSLPTNSFRAIFSEINGSVDAQTALHLQRLRMNGQDTGSGSPSEVSSHGMSLNNSAGRIMEGNQRLPMDTKKINVPSSPERAQVERRLSQIQDYIKQTSSLIESYRLSSLGASDDTNTEFLVGVLKDLCDSEEKLKSLLSAFDLLSMEDELKSGPEPSGVESANPMPVPAEHQVNGDDHFVGAPKSTDAKKQSEIKIKFDESLRQLHALQTEQAFLTQKRIESQEQLQEAQRARNMLLAMTASGCPVNAQGDSMSGMGPEEHLREAVVNNLQDADRLAAGRSKNQLMAKADIHQASPSRELPNRKRQTTDASDVTTYLKEMLTGDEVKEQASSEDSAVEDAIDEYADARAQVRLQGQIVQDKVAEINALRTQLDQAKSLLNMAQRREGKSQTSDNNSADEAPADQAVNIQRQRKGDGDVTTFNQSDSRKTKTSSKHQLLDQERAKLGRLRAMLATIQEYRSSGLPVPEHIMSQFGSEALSSGSRSTSPAHTVGSHKGAHEEDAAVEADVEEDDEPESAAQWNQQHLSLIESATMASELSQGLQQRAAQLQVERDGLAAMQRQLDGLFNQLQQQKAAENSSDTTNVGEGSIADSLAPSQCEARTGQETRIPDEATQRRLEIMSDLHSRWQQLQDEIALDGELNVKAAPVLHAAKSALNLLATQILPDAEVSEDSVGDIAWDRRSHQGRHQATPTRSEHTPRTSSRDRQFHDGSQMSSAPSTLMRRPVTDVTQNQRAVWSSANAQDIHSSSNNTFEPLRYNSVPPEDNPPIVSMPSPSPSVLQQQTQEMKNRLVALSHSCQSLCMDTMEGVNSSPTLPFMPPPPAPQSGSSSHDREVYYQQLLAAGQLQQHQVLMTAVNQCFHILKMQQHEILNLSNSLHMLTSGASQSVGVHPGVLPGAHPRVNAGVHQGVHPGVHPGLLPNEEQWPSPSPAPGPGPPTLNNQVPPGNRTNNYWDNFRSYSRQNLLSTSAKSNEGLPHSPSPLVERSHNSLRSSTPMTVPGASTMSVTSTMPHFHTMSTPPCLPGLTQTAGVSDSVNTPLGAVGPALPASMDLPHPPPLVQNIPRKDKRNIDHTDGGQGSPRRRSPNEIDHRTASRVLDDAALSLNSQMLSPASQDFEVPSMPILRNSVVTLQSRLNQVNLNAPPSLANLQDFIEAQNARQQLNNEGVPFSEISSSLSNQQFNEFGGFSSVDHAREGSRRLNMDYHNGADEVEPSSSTVLKRNTGAIKRTYTTSQNSVHNPSGYSPNYQRNIHSSSTPLHVSSNNSSSNTDCSNATLKLSSVFPVSNSDTDTVFKSTKQQSGHDTTRNYNSVSRRPTFQEDFQAPCSSTSSSSRSRMHGINETDDRQSFHHDEDTEYEDIPLLRGVGFNNCQSSTSSLSSSSQNTSNTEVPSFGSSKNQVKESCFQVRKYPKYQTLSGSRSTLSETSVAAAAAAVAVAQNSPAHRNVHRSSTKSQTANCQRVVNKNNQEFSVPNSVPGQGQLFEELRESVYAEMTSLIAANGGKSHFLVQLLRDLQHISSDSVRQSVLQLIQLAVSRYQIDPSTLGHEGFSLGLEDEAEEDEDEAKRIETQRLPYAGACSSSDQKESATSTEEGETLMQLVLGLELAAVFSANADETCSPNLIEDVRSRILQLIPMPQSMPLSNMQPFNSPRSASYLQSQIDSVLESVLLKFQGRRIGDVRSEITSSVISALPIKLMYRSMVEFYSRNNMETEAHSRRESTFRENAMSPSGHGPCQSPHQYSQHSHHMNHQDGRDVGLLAEASNGDLAEADQSHHTLNAVDGEGDSEADRDCSTEGPLSASLSESASTLLHVHVYQLGGTSEGIDSEPEVEALQEEGDGMACAAGDRNSCRNDLMGAVGGAGVSTIEKDNHENIPETWTSEQDCDRDDLEKEREREREQGLDQVPTRLACDGDRDQENGEKHRSHHLAMPPNDSSSS